MRSSVLSLALSLAVVALCASGCATASGPDAEHGTLEIPLQQSGPDGALYHLSATLQIDGPGGTQIIDATGFQESITLTLPPGLTNVTLLDGWTLERSVDGITYAPVSAVLGTLNPFGIRVLANFSDTLVFQFIVRQAIGQVTVSFGVTLHPRLLAGGMIVDTGTGDFAAYTGARLDYAIYHDATLDRLTLGDGTKQLVLSSGALAAEFFNDPVGILTSTIGPSMTGASFQYHFDAKPDGTQEITGELRNSVVPFPRLTFGPHTLQSSRLPLDADGFPTDVLFSESGVPFTLNLSAPGVDPTITGTLLFRSVPVSN
jgi:hypothetical protein